MGQVLLLRQRKEGAKEGRGRAQVPSAAPSSLRLFSPRQSLVTLTHSPLQTASALLLSLLHTLRASAPTRPPDRPPPNHSQSFPPANPLCCSLTGALPLLAAARPLKKQVKKACQHPPAPRSTPFFTNTTLPSSAPILPFLSCPPRSRVRHRIAQ